MKKYSFVGSDERTNYLRKMFLEEGYEITDILKSDIVVTSIPFSKNDKTLNSEDLSVEDFIRLTKNKIVITGSIKEYIKAKFDKSTKIIDIWKNRKKSCFKIKRNGCKCYLPSKKRN